MKASLDLKKRNCKMRKFLKILLVYAIEKKFLIFLPEAYKEYFYIIMFTQYFSVPVDIYL